MAGRGHRQSHKIHLMVVVHIGKNRNPIDIRTDRHDCGSLECPVAIAEEDVQLRRGAGSDAELRIDHYQVSRAVSIQVRHVCNHVHEGSRRRSRTVKCHW